MSNALYDVARAGLLRGEINWITDTIYCVLVKSGTSNTVTSPSATMEDITNPQRDYGTEGSEGVQLQGRAVTSNGAADGLPVTFTNVGAAGIGSADAIGAIVLYKHTGADDSLNIPILWLDTATGLPITPNTGSIIINWDQGSNRIFRP